MQRAIFTGHSQNAQGERADLDHLLVVRDGELVLIDAGREYKSAVSIYLHMVHSLIDLGHAFLAPVMPPRFVSDFLPLHPSMPCSAHSLIQPSICTACIFPVNDTFTSPQRQLSSAPGAHRNRKSARKRVRIVFRSICDMKPNYFGFMSPMILNRIQSWLQLVLVNSEYMRAGD